MKRREKEEKKKKAQKNLNPIGQKEYHIAKPHCWDIRNYTWINKPGLVEMKI